MVASLRLWIKNLVQLEQQGMLALSVFIAVFPHKCIPAGLIVGVLIWIHLSATMFVFSAAVSW